MKRREIKTSRMEKVLCLLSGHVDGHGDCIPISAADIRKHLGIPQPSCHRLVHDMHNGDLLFAVNGVHEYTLPVDIQYPADFIPREPAEDGVEDGGGVSSIHVREVSVRDHVMTSEDVASIIQEARGDIEDVLDAMAFRLLGR